MSVATPWLLRAARRRPTRAALSTPDGTVTYAELLAAAGRAAGTLAVEGVRRGDQVVTAMAPGGDLVVTLHALWLLGAVPRPVSHRATAAELMHVAGNRRVLRARPDGPPAPYTPAPVEPSSLAMVVHTSGTTGPPSPVSLTWGNVEANALGSAVALGLDPHERWLCPMPLAHVGGLMVLLRSALYATTVVLEPPPFDADRVAHLLSEVTLASLVPTMLARVLDRIEDGGSPPPERLRAVLLGGAAAPRPLLERAAALGVPVSPSYGLTQSCSQAVTADPGDMDSAGYPLPGVTVEIAADGEIVLSGPTVVGGGPLPTGDLGRIDPRGRLVVVGRKSELIVTGGENVAPAEVEAVLLADPSVVDAAVYGRPDPEWGEAVVARLVLRPGRSLDPGALRARCADALSPWKVPKDFEVAGSLPRTASGKLLRRQLVEEAGESGPEAADRP